MQEHPSFALRTHMVHLRCVAAHCAALTMLSNRRVHHARGKCTLTGSPSIYVRETHGHTALRCYLLPHYLITSTQAMTCCDRVHQHVRRGELHELADNAEKAHV